MSPDEAKAEAEALSAFYDRLEAGLFKHDATPAERAFYRSVRGLSEYRFHHLGAQQYGFAYMDRDNIAELNDEVADALNYLFMADQKTHRLTGEHVALDVLLTGAMKIYEGIEMIASYPSKLRGSP